MSRQPLSTKKQTGFSLIEVMIALVIMSMLGLMSWRGLDGLIRGKERIEAYSRQHRDMHYALALLDRDCNAMLRAETLGFPPVLLSNESVWWMRSMGNNDKPGWQLVGYQTKSDGLFRMISAPFATRDIAREAWQTLVKAPDKGYPGAEAQFLSADIQRQQIRILSDLPNTATPVKALQFVWQVIANDPYADRALTRVCLAGGF